MVDEGSDQQIVIVGYTNLREIYLIDEDWVLNLNVSGTTADGELSDEPVPLAMKEQRRALLTIADAIQLRQKQEPDRATITDGVVHIFDRRSGEALPARTGHDAGPTNDAGELSLPGVRPGQTGFTSRAQPDERGQVLLQH